jgi:hypothetical protein
MFLVHEWRIGRRIQSAMAAAEDEVMKVNACNICVILVVSTSLNPSLMVTYFTLLVPLPPLTHVSSLCTPRL